MWRRWALLLALLAAASPAVAEERPRCAWRSFYSAPVAAAPCEAAWGRRKPSPSRPLALPPLCRLLELSGAGCENTASGRCARPGRSSRNLQFCRCTHLPLPIAAVAARSPLVQPFAGGTSRMTRAMCALGTHSTTKPAAAPREHCTRATREPAGNGRCWSFSGAVAVSLLPVVGCCLILSGSCLKFGMCRADQCCCSVAP